MSRFARFALVGGAGFLVDAAVLAVLLAVMPFGPLLARIASIGVALLVTWRLNRALTFGASHRRQIEEGARYAGVGFSTSLVNYAVFAALMALMPATPPLLALAVASAVAMVFSFAGYSRLVFARR